MGGIVHAWRERQVTVWLADLMSMTRRRRKPTYLCFLYFEDSTVQKIMGQSGGSFLSRILLEERILQPPGALVPWEDTHTVLCPRGRLGCFALWCGVLNHVSSAGCR